MKEANGALREAQEHSRDLQAEVGIPSPRSIAVLTQLLLLLLLFLPPHRIGNGLNTQNSECRALAFIPRTQRAPVSLTGAQQAVFLAAWSA